MSVPTDLLVLARHARVILYDRAAIDAAVAAHLAVWQLSRPRVQVVIRTTRATLDVIESLPGTTLEQRWAAFEAGVWPRWKAGDRRPLRRKEGWLNRPGMSGDSEPWEGWSHGREHIEEVSG